MIEDNKVVLIPIDEIIPNRFQPRLKFNEKELQNLAESISEHGIVSPITVRKIGDKYEIVAGERRFKAATLIGLPSVPCIVMQLDDQESAEIAVIENLQRSNLTPIEEAKSYDKLLSKGVTQEQLAKRLGVSQPTIANKIRLLGLSKSVQEALLNGKISERHARSLLQITDENMQKNMLDIIITNRLTVKQTDDEVNAVLGKIPNAPGTHDIFDVDVTEIKENAKEIIKPIQSIDFEALLRKDNFNEEVQVEETSPKIPDIIKVEDPIGNYVNLGINSPSNLDTREENIFNNLEEDINPFQTVEIFNDKIENDFKDSIIQTEIKEEPQNLTQIINSDTVPLTNLMDEFLKGNSNIIETKEELEEEIPVKKETLRDAIDVARDASSKIKEKGFNIDTEEFDFEDMYQIVIKIKKN